MPMDVDSHTRTVYSHARVFTITFDRRHGSASPTAELVEERRGARMTAAQATIVDGGPDLLASAVAIKPVLARNAAEAETLRALPSESFAALRDAGMFKLTVPRRFGGHEVPF